jgi:hypothetical protein
MQTIKEDAVEKKTEPPKVDIKKLDVKADIKKAEPAKTETKKPEEPTKPARSIIKRGDIATTFKTTKLSSQKAAPLKMTQQQMDLQKKAGAAFFKPSTSVSE